MSRRSTPTNRKSLHVFLHMVDRVIGDALEHVLQIALRTVSGMKLAQAMRYGLVGDSGARLAALPWERYAGRPVPLLQSLRIALILKGVDIGSRGTGFLSGIQQMDDVDFLLAACERALLRLRRETLIQ
jgi:hypothetical protein